MQNNLIAGIAYVAGCFTMAGIAYITYDAPAFNKIYQPPQTANVFDFVTFKRVNIEGVDCIVGSSKRYSTLSMECNWALPSKNTD